MTSQIPEDGAAASAGVKPMSKSKLLQEAEAAAREAVTLAPDQMRVHIALADVLGQAGKVLEAVGVLRNAAHLQQTMRGQRLRLALLLARFGQVADAIEVVRGMVAHYPDDANLHLHLARLLFRSGDYGAAVLSCLKAASLAPDQAHIHAELGRTQFRLGELEPAAAAIGKAIELQPDNDNFHVLLSNVYARQGLWPLAVAAAQRAATLVPDKARNQITLGMALLQSGDAAGAEPRLVRALELDPDNPVIKARLNAVRGVSLRNVEDKKVRPTDGEPEIRTPHTPDDVAFGRDGWLFHRIQNAFGQICHGEGLDEESLSRLLAILEARDAWCKVRGIDYRLLIVPERHVLYPDKLPEGWTPHPRRPAMQVLSAADTSLRPSIVYPVEALLAGREKHEVCCKTDLHWTTYGTYLAYRELMQSLQTRGIQIIPEDALTRKQVARVGGMSLWLGDRTRENLEWFTPPPAEFREVVGNRTLAIGQVEVFETARADLPRLVMFRTSNSTTLMPYLFHHFSRIVAVATTATLYDLLRDERPDVVFTEIPERYLAVVSAKGVVLPRDFSLGSFHDVTGLKLPLSGSRSAQRKDSR